MNIYLPIITNFIIALVLLTGVLVGKANGFKLQLIKFILVCVSLVGTYFLTPIVSNALLGIEAINNFISDHGIFATTFNSFIFFAMSMVVYLIISAIIVAIRDASRRAPVAKKLNSAKSIKPRKELRRERKRFNRLHGRQISKCSKVFGAILGFILAVIIGYVIMIPTKCALNNMATNDEKLEQVTAGYEYTMYNVFDEKVFDVTEFVVER